MKVAGASHGFYTGKSTNRAPSGSLRGLFPSAIFDYSTSGRTAK
jgi:hypothetical protein